jgi:hypothetical protein
LAGLKKLFPDSSVLDENASEAIKRITDAGKCTCAACTAALHAAAAKK